MSRNSKIQCLIAIICIIALTVVGALLDSRSAESHGPYTIHYVNYSGRTSVDAGFEDHLRNRGVPYKIKYHDVSLNPNGFSGILQEIEDDGDTDLIVTWGTTVTLGTFASYNDSWPTFLTNMPGIFLLVTDPTTNNIAPNTMAPGRSITGTWHIAPIDNQFRSMMIYKPSTKKIGVLFTPTDQNAVMSVTELKRAAALHNVEVVAIPFDVDNGAPVSTNAATALQKMHKVGVSWLYLPPDSFLSMHAKDLVIPIAHGLGIPTFASTEQFMKTGATFGLICSYYELGELTAAKAEKILIGKISPESLPIDSIDRFHHQMNAAVANKLGIQAPSALAKSIKIVNQ